MSKKIVEGTVFLKLNNNNLPNKFLQAFNIKYNIILTGI
tara:strand:+ start:12250 stop:12366 length:117 start_codon:yes stop_codon:yes gene_type:complete